MSQPATSVQGETTLMQRHAWIKRRAEVRYQCGPATAGKLVRDGGPQQGHAWVVNLSTAGVGLLLNEPLEPETPLVVHVKSIATGRLFELRARVVHNTVQASGDWLVGCELAQRLEPDDLEALL
jgi:PilZ domain